MVISGVEECDIDNPATTSIDEAECADAYHYCDVEDYPTNAALASCVCTVDEYCGDGIVNGTEQCDYNRPGESFCTLGCIIPPGGNGPGGNGGIGGTGGSSVGTSASSVSSSTSSPIMVWCCNPATEFVNPAPQAITTCGGTKFNISRVTYAQAQDRCKPQMWCCIHENFTSCGNAPFVPIGATQQNECWGSTFTRGIIYYSPADANACANVCN